MSFLFSAEDVLETAIQIEKNGAAFYDMVARATGNVEARRVFGMLLEAEHSHQATFEEMLANVRSSEGAGEKLFEDRSLFIKSLAEDAVFTGQEVIAGMARRSTSDAEAVQIGINFEKDSVLYYTEMRDIVRRVDRDVLDRVIGEEKKHLAILTDLLKKVRVSPQV